VVAPEGYEAAVWTAVKNVATGTSSLHNAAALSLVADGTVDRVIAEKLEEGARRNAAARAVLGESVCWPGAACAWHLWVKLPEHVTPQVFEARMAGCGVAISGGNWFAAGLGAPNGFRMALGGEVDAAMVHRGVELVAEEMQKL
jgi:DNA-binding transcriptional MocR family regulator